MRTQPNPRQNNTQHQCKKDKSEKLQKKDGRTNASLYQEDKKVKEINPLCPMAHMYRMWNQRSMLQPYGTYSDIDP